MQSDNHAMISIRPEFVEGILAGTKTVELRRRFISLPIGSTLWIYATLPVGAIMAVATVYNIDHDHPKEIWRKYHGDVGVQASHFDNYFEGCGLGVAIQLSEVRQVTPLTLETIREIRGVQQIPQVAVRISKYEATEFSENSRLVFA